MMLGALLAMALAASAECDFPEAAGAADPETARAYLEVGDSELASGSTDTARVAYREALRLDPANQRAQEGFLKTCAQATTLASGRALMDAGDCGKAIAIFDRLRKSRPDRTAVLLEGICLYEEGRDEAARTLLVEAHAAPELAARAAYFLGLIELRHGAGSEAAAHFHEAARSREWPIAERAEVLRNVAYRTGRAQISIFAESGYDSNVDFTPDGRPASADGAGAAGLSASLRPLGVSGPYLRLSGLYRWQAQVHDRDLGLLGGMAGWRHGLGESYLFGDYGFEATFLGGAPYLWAHRLRAGARYERKRVAFFLPYAVRFGAYQTDSADPYSGVLHTLDPQLSRRFPLGSSIGVGYHFARDFAQTRWASSQEHGPRIALRLVLLPSLRASAEVGALWRSFDERAEGDLAARSDRILYLRSAVEKDFADRFTLRLSGENRFVKSNLSAYSYSRLTVALTLSYTLGLY